MAKKSRYLPYRQVRVREAVASVAKESAEKRYQTLAQWVTEAIISRLEREGNWPPTSTVNNEKK